MKTEDAVLESLRRSRERFISGEELARELSVTRAAVWKAIEGLRRLGYEVTAHPHAGYRLDGVPDRLYADEIRLGLETEYMGLSTHAYENCDSTNDIARSLAQQNAPEGTLVVAERQLKGRGRLGRTWSSPAGKNLLFSLVLRPRLTPDAVGRLTLVSAVSMVRTIREQTGVQAAIKWPNDLVYRDKKLGGILTEMSAEADRVHFCVVGIGVNLNSDPDALPEGAASLKKLSGQTVPRVPFLRRFLEVFERDYETLKAGRFDLLADDWRRYSHTISRRVTASLPDRQIEGQAVDIDAAGMLWIRRDNGLQERVTSGDIRHLRAVSKAAQTKGAA